jgi:hypothetical protein
VFDAESSAKQAELAEAVDLADVVVLASRRGYGALSRTPAKSQETLIWYQDLLLHSAVRVFTRCPRLGPVALTDDPLADAGLPSIVPLATRCGARWALQLPQLDESFRVYDAPLVIVAVPLGLSDR